MRVPVPSPEILSEIPPFHGFPVEGDRFFRALAKHNEKPWFEAHRAEYDAHVLGPMRAFVVEAGAGLRRKWPKLQADPRVGGSIFRIHRDTRFSKDKTPYKTACAARMWDARGPAKDATAGFYVHVEAGAVYLGAGVYQFADDQLARYRAALGDAKVLKLLRKALADAKGLEPGGRTLKRPPRGFDADHPAGELLLHKGLYAGRDLDAASMRSASAIGLALREYGKVFALHAWLMEHVVLA